MFVISEQSECMSMTNQSERSTWYRDTTSVHTSRHQVTRRVITIQACVSMKAKCTSMYANVYPHVYVCMCVCVYKLCMLLSKTRTNDHPRSVNDSDALRQYVLFTRSRAPPQITPTVRGCVWWLSSD